MIRTYKPRHELAPYAGGMTLQKADLSSKILATLVPAATCSESPGDEVPSGIGN